jgi:hypothetical protein
MNQPQPTPNAEELRLAQAHTRRANWQRWGPYLSERQWGTVREDYSENGDSWNYFTHDHARSRAYRWGEDGLMGICDRECRMCFSMALWNGRDPILKERLFGLSGPEGNHGEDVKECYYYLDSTPTHSYMKGLYKYPQARFPYESLTDTNRTRTRTEAEFELCDTGAFDGGRYFDVQIEYAKGGPDDVLIRIRIHNRGEQSAVLHALPTLWFRNSWVWGCDHEGCSAKPRMWEEDGRVLSSHESLGNVEFRAAPLAGVGQPTWLWTENETNPARHPSIPTAGKHFKDAFHQFVISGDVTALAANRRGTKVAAYFLQVIPAGGMMELRLRLASEGAVESADWFDDSFDQVFAARIQEADAFYDRVLASETDPERRSVSRQSYAGLLWTKQFYHYAVAPWQDGDPNGPAAAPHRKGIRNADWRHLFNRDIISMPDKWEYPWYAAWDSAFHMLPMARVDLEFAKQQLLLFLREWYMHPNGQIPAYEWALGDVNPPVHAWACWRVYKLTGAAGDRDKEFLARAFQKLLLNFTWWVNRKDPRGRNIFAGGFLGLDNIGVFDRSKPLPGGYLEQADGTAWMAFYCGCLLQMALELAPDSEAYADMASKLFEHYVSIAEAMNAIDGIGLWDERDGFYYDHLYLEGRGQPMRIRSLVGLIPLLTPVILYEHVIDGLPGFRKRLNWFLNHRRNLAKHITYLERGAQGAVGPLQRLLAIPSQERCRRLLTCMLDEREFLGPYGIRSLSAVHRDQPFVFEHGGQRQEVRYVPGESESGLFGGNSNWRGPVWFPMNYLIIFALRRYHRFYGDEMKVECPTGSGKWCNLEEVACELEQRLIRLFLPDAKGRRPVHGTDQRYASDPHWKDLNLFYEYFHGDSGRGLGASHQTGWTSLVTIMLEHQARVACKPAS